MANVCVVGMQWGDEGKARIVDLLTEEADIVVRTQGGANAGHTVVVGEDTFKLHLIPSGIIHRGKECVIGNGVALDPVSMLEEIEKLRGRGIDVGNNLHISDRAHIVFEYHKLFDTLSESKKGQRKIGTTGKGIGPCYADKIARNGIRVVDLFNPKSFKTRLKSIVEEKNRLLKEIYEHDPLDWGKMYDTYSDCARKIKPWVTDTAIFLNEAIREGKNILFEGAQGSLLDVDFGTYPYVTSSNASVAGVSAGAGISPKAISKIVGIMKAYTTRVGEGPFPTELDDDTGEAIRSVGKEFGTTTGRPRRCGWFDGVIGKYTAMINGVDSIALTKLDVLDDLETVKVCVAYEYEDTVIEHFPSSIEVLMECKPRFVHLPGWKEDITHVRDYNDLPVNARQYIEFIESFLEVPIKMISVGPERSQGIRR